MERHKEPENLLTDVRINRVGQDYSRLRDKLVEHYVRSWTKVGLQESVNEVERRLDSYNMESVYIATDVNKEKIYGMLLTANSTASSVLGVLKEFPLYSSFQGLTTSDKNKKAKASICFSITADSSFRVKLPLLPVDISISEYLLFNYPFEPAMRKFAYSRIPGVWGSQIYDFYRDNIRDPKRLGPTGMHESKYKGIVVAIVNGSRAEDASGGKGNTLVAFPKSDKERVMFEQVKQKRAETGNVPFRKYKNFILFTDTSLK